MPMTIRTALQIMGDSSFSILCIFFALPFMQPIPLGPFSVAAGGTYVALGWQMMRGRHSPWLPEKMLDVSLEKKSWERIVWISTKLAAVIDFISKPRLQSWVNTPSAHKRLGALVCLSGILMTIPMFGVPFNNTLPALVALSAGIAEIESDGVWILIALFFLLTTCVYFFAIGWALFSAGEYFAY